MSSSLYPVALNISSKKCIVIGGGKVGTRKALALAESGALVTVVSPEATLELRNAATAGVLQYCPVAFAPQHLTDAFLVIAATDSPEVNATVAVAGQEQGSLVNIAGDALEESGDFSTMAVIRRGDLTIALTTGGAGPALTARLRREMELYFGPEWIDYVELLRKMRERAKNEIPEPELRANALRKLVAMDSLREKIKAGEQDTAEEEALKCLLP